MNHEIALESALASPRTAGQEEMVLIPGGSFCQGSPTWVLDWLQEEGQAFAREWFADEHPLIAADVAPYWIDRRPVTIAQFASFVRETGYVSDAENAEHGQVYSDVYWEERPGACWRRPAGHGSTIDGRADHPVVHISWPDASAYARWAGKRLPTEAEWEFAARGPRFRLWPWGDEWDSQRANTAEYHAGPMKSLDSWRQWWQSVRRREGAMPQTTAVGTFGASGSSPFGCDDMAGNVYEWTSTTSFLYEDTVACDAALRVVMGRYIVIRGGSWMNFRYQVRCAERMHGDPDGWSNFALGFRCAKDAEARKEHD